MSFVVCAIIGVSALAFTSEFFAGDTNPDFTDGAVSDDSPSDDIKREDKEAAVTQNGSILNTPNIAEGASDDLSDSTKEPPRGNSTQKPPPDNNGNMNQAVNNGEQPANGNNNVPEQLPPVQQNVQPNQEIPPSQNVPNDPNDPVKAPTTTKSVTSPGEQPKPLCQKCSKSPCVCCCPDGSCWECNVCTVCKMNPCVCSLKTCDCGEDETCGKCWESKICSDCGSNPCICQ